MSKSTTNSIVETLEGIFAKAPALPPNAKDTIVKIMPILALVFGVLGLLGSLAGLGVMTAVSPLAVVGAPTQVPSYGLGFIGVLGGLVSSVLLLAAYSGVKAGKIEGWNKLFWSELVSLVSSLISMALVSGVIWAAVGFYILFQIKSHYK